MKEQAPLEKRTIKIQVSVGHLQWQFFMLFWKWILKCILIASPGSMHETGHSGPVHWDDPEGWDGKGGGREGQDGEHMCTHGWFMSMYGRNHHNIVK